MPEDIRLYADFPGHFKTRKLIASAGPEAPYRLIKLWLYCADRRPDGSLAGMSDADIEIAADAPDGFAKAIANVGFLDGEELHRTVHQWEEHQPWLANKQARKDQARRAISARWNTGRIRAVYSQNTQRNTPNPTHPLPLGEESPSTPLVRLPSNGVAVGFDEFWKAYPKKVGKGYALKVWTKLHPNAATRAAIIAAIAEQRTWPKWQEDDGQYIPNPSTWLNQQRWFDQPTEKLDARPRDWKPPF